MHRTAFTVQFPTHACEVQRNEDIAIRCTPGDKMVRFYCVVHLLWGLNGIPCLAASQKVAVTGNAMQRLVRGADASL